MSGGRDREDPAGPTDVVLRLPDDLRAAFKDPLGSVYQDAERLLRDAGTPLLAVGDVVTAHLLEADRRPDVAVVDGYTERSEIDPEVRATLGDLEPDVSNPPATLTAGLLTALAEAVASDDRSTIAVDGEEDLATLPAVLLAPEGASVVYGQPGEGMVLVSVDRETKRRFEDLLERMDGDHDRVAALLGIDDRR